MSFLTPLYLLGALAVTLPILFHMIRRTPRDRREFSSVMFLDPSLPKITKRSRIEHWLLLALRALAVCLLALAFARPFFRESQQQAVEGDDGRAIVLLVDTSASMRREGVWEDAVEKIEETLRQEIEPIDRVAVLTFDRRLRTVCGFDQWSEIDFSGRADAVRSTIAKTSPGWSGTNLAAALIEAAEQLDALTTNRDLFLGREVIVVSDLQAGCRLEALSAYDWPKGVSVRLLRVGGETSPNNAGLHAVADSATVSSTKPQTRVRVINAAVADQDEFQIRWTDEFDGDEFDKGEFDRDDSSVELNAPQAKTVSVIVPAGQGRIVRATARPGGPGPGGPGIGRLRLTGDEQEFDNVCYVPPARPMRAVVALLSDERADDPQGLRFYLPAALPSLPQRVMEVIEWRDAGVDVNGQTIGDKQRPHLVIVTGAVPDVEVETLRGYLRSGGTLVWAGSSVGEASSLSSLLSWQTGAVAEIVEADVDGYAMLAEIDFAHPLFAPLDDVRFSDFTKVRFWKHRRLPVGALPSAKVLARFDDGDAAIVEARLGKGRLVLFAAGWHPDDSQLAMSSKFVPMLNGLVDDVAGIAERRMQYVVGDSVSFAEFDLTADNIRAIRTPSGEQEVISRGDGSFAATDVPGVYKFVLREGEDVLDEAPSFVVNLDSAESRTSPLAADVLVSAGVRLSVEEAAPFADAEGQRQLRATELESRQKLWRWLVFAVIGILLIETLLASRMAKRQLTAR